MNTRFLESFLLVVELGSFRAAAERLCVTQAAISNRIAALEEEIGARVFVRDSRELRLTPVGRRMIGYGERMLELQGDIMQLARCDQKMLGSVRIGAIDTIVHTWLIDFVEHLQSSYPGIEIQLSAESTEQLNRSLRDGEVDVALQTDQMIGDGMISHACLPMAMGWIGRPGDGSAGLDSHEILARPVVSMSRGSQPYLALRDVYKRVGLPMRKVHCANSIAAIVRLVKCGLGYALIPLPPVREQVDRGELEIIPFEMPLPSQALVVSFMESRASDAIRCVAELACQEADRFVRSLPTPFAVK
ncbi:LysR family transcriptional regulator [Burkholderia sp. BCC1972]|uniref:LysR family transcriptional regulator n=1 Tax=Burkholderia sp. BCC1972 TaxID=2817438 RepID=UPI002ABD2884|nr:LysR family transcriptional regulator [Burkholderia sp. BCC1972]